MKKWKQINWADINNKIPGMKNQLNYFDKQCLNMPNEIKMTDDYKLLRQDITNMQKTMPFIVYLTLPTIKPRHFRKLLTLIKHKIEQKSQTVLPLSDVEVEEKVKSAQTKIQEVEEFWKQQGIEMVKSEIDGVEKELGPNAQAVGKLDSHIMSLITLDAQESESNRKDV